MELSDDEFRRFLADYSAEIRRDRFNRRRKAEKRVSHMVALLEKLHSTDMTTKELAALDDDVLEVVGG